MNIKVIAVGKLKERYWQDAVKEYSKRLGRFCRLSITEIKESQLAANPSAADEEAVKDAEGLDILDRLKPSDYVITLEIDGSSMTSPQLASRIESLTVSGKSSIAFIIGGSLGLSREVRARADMKLSFSAMTFPHQMARVILLEQIYRAFKIIHNETYHK